MANISISLEIEPIVKLVCEELHCRHNLANRPGGFLACELKHLRIAVGGTCASLEMASDQASRPDRTGVAL